MSEHALALLVDPALAEEAVLRTISGRPEERRFRRERNRLYDLPLEERETAFASLHLRWFAALGLDEQLRQPLDELPILADHCFRCVVARARSRDDQGADLLVDDAASGREGRTVAVRLLPAAFAHPEALRSFLRFELLHVADMVNPHFGYEPRFGSSLPGPCHEQLLRDRYRVLWDVRIAGLLARRGAADAELVERVRAAFFRWFPMLGPEEAEKALAGLYAGDWGTHAELVRFAAAPAGRAERPRLAPGMRCPLCRFPTYAPEPAPEQLPAEVVEQVRADFPNWQPTDGLCIQCADLYRARVTLTSSGVASAPV